jgi:RNA polymerase sigma-70 factor (ECF subfamily)
MPSSAESLSTIMRRVAQRDRQAFAALYQATSAKLYGVIVRITRRGALADEVLQEVFVKIWDRAAEFDGTRGSAITWMATIARNRALDEVRRKAPIAIEDSAEAQDATDGSEHPLDRQERSQALARVMECLEALDPDKRQILLLAYYRGMSREALGKRFSAPVSTIKTWLHRSLAQIRTCVDQ